MTNARICDPEFKKLYCVWTQTLHEERAKIMKEKEIALQQLREKAVMKEKLTTEITKHSCAKPLARCTSLTSKPEAASATGSVV